MSAFGVVELQTEATSENPIIGYYFNRSLRVGDTFLSMEDQDYYYRVRSLKSGKVFTFNQGKERISKECIAVVKEKAGGNFHPNKETISSSIDIESEDDEENHPDAKAEMSPNEMMNYIGRPCMMCECPIFHGDIKYLENVEMHVCLHEDSIIESNCSPVAIGEHSNLSCGEDLYSIKQDFWDNPAVCQQCKEDELAKINWNTLLSLYAEQWETTAT